MSQGASTVAFLFPLMNSFDKTEVAISQCKLCFLMVFHFLRLNQIRKSIRSGSPEHTIKRIRENRSLSLYPLEQSGNDSHSKTLLVTFRHLDTREFDPLLGCEACQTTRKTEPAFKQDTCLLVWQGLRIGRLWLLTAFFPMPQKSLWCILKVSLTTQFVK